MNPNGSRPPGPFRLGHGIAVFAAERHLHVNPCSIEALAQSRVEKARLRNPRGRRLGGLKVHVGVSRTFEGYSTVLVVEILGSFLQLLQNRRELSQSAEKIEIASRVAVTPHEAWGGEEKRARSPGVKKDPTAGDAS